MAMHLSLPPWILRWRARVPLAQQIAAQAAVLCIMLALLTAWWAGELARQQAVTRIQTSMNSLAGTTADRYGTYLFDRLRDISDIAQFEALQSIWAGRPDQVRQALMQMQQDFPAYAWIGFASPDGTVLASTGGLLEGQSVAERPWFVAGLQAPVIEDVHEATRLASLLPSESSTPLRFVDVAVPVRGPNRTLLGVLGAHVSWTWGENLRQLILTRLDPRLRTDIWILNDEGQSLLGLPFGEQPFAPQTISTILDEGHLTFTDEGAQPALTSALVTDSGGTPSLPRWIVVTRRPVSVVYADADAIRAGIMWAGLIFALVGVGGALAIGIYVSRPLHRLAVNVDRVGREPGASMLGRESGTREIVNLSTAIRSLLLRAATAEGAELAARQTATAIEQRMEEKTRQLGEHISTLQTLADTDPLTRLLNRRAFMTFATDAMAQFTRYDRPFSILLIDIDFFKRVNDTYGHSVGDQVIQIVASRTSAELRTTDKVARFGGEEFVVLLRETDVDGTLALAERIRSAISEAVIDVPPHDPLHVTASIGVAVAQPDDRDAEDTIERADRALYRAKHDGRNAVRMDGGGRLTEAA
jgi:diguanylate cyclase (GGDEF)-like protein